MSVILLALIATIFGLRGHRLIGVVLEGRAADPPLPADGDAQAELALLARRDSLLTAGEPPWQDPFRPRPRVSTGRATSPRAAQPQVAGSPSAPRLGSLLFDQVRPSVQIRSDTTTSGWLHEGETFAGWTVVRITPSSVTLTSGVQTIDLP